VLRSQQAALVKFAIASPLSQLLRIRQACLRVPNLYKQLRCRRDPDGIVISQPPNYAKCLKFFGLPATGVFLHPP
jgi:hypothetical protein